ncbi:hypothetical protein J1N35_029085 [Gossypium stocksii]|uniref:Uncharacterized protein n=1 Tax=Gossypium stocksii TaxID=47602 RepID=A0A9D3UXD4_9ROSI|nr:hypothetical protein J1N35_029085 [Gossypium stocksii]
MIDDTHALIEAHRMILIVGVKLSMINLTQGSSTNNPPISRNLLTCSISRSKKIASASSMMAPTGPVEDVSTNFPPC